MNIVWVSRTAFDFMVAEAKDKIPYESGGVLLGYLITPREAVVVRAVGPGPNAIHSHSSFSPDGEYHWAEIEAEFKTTEGRHAYLGDWHTHPDGGACLSERDCKTLRKIANDPKSQTSHPLMFILFGGKPWLGAIWRWEPRSWRKFVLDRRVSSLKIQFYQDDKLADNPSLSTGSPSEIV